MKIKKIYNDVYYAYFVFVLTDSISDVDKKFNIIWNGIGGCIEINEKIYIFFNPSNDIEQLVHECEHAVSELWKSRGIDKCIGADEAFAYMLQWLFKKCYESWNRTT